jgi:hypothetical protein
MAVSAATVEDAVFAGGRARSAQCSPAHLRGSWLTGSPGQRVAVKKNPMRLAFGISVMNDEEAMARSRNPFGGLVKCGEQVHSFLATSGPVMRASSGKVAAMMPRDARIPPAVRR